MCHLQVSLGSARHGKPIVASFHNMIKTLVGIEGVDTVFTTDVGGPYGQ
jgi:hypothetical protein